MPVVPCTHSHCINPNFQMLRVGVLSAILQPFENCGPLWGAGLRETKEIWRLNAMPDSELGRGSGGDAMKDNWREIGVWNMYHLLIDSILSMFYFLTMTIKLWLYKRMPLFFGENTPKYLLSKGTWCLQLTLKRSSQTRNHASPHVYGKIGEGYTDGHQTFLAKFL